MSDYFTEVELALRAAVRERAGAGRRRGLRSSRARAVVLALLLLATAGTALAAGGVLPFGSSVPLSGSPNAEVGSGIPTPGGAELLPLRISDPDGGLPWGARLVRTTRGLLCLQVGRVQDGRLGELGIDGAFHDDGRFHPLPAGALPEDVPFLGSGSSGYSANASCHLRGEAFDGEQIGMDRSAGGGGDTTHSPFAHLRDVYFGLLGKPALSVTYDTGTKTDTEQVVRGVGAYLIVLASEPGDMRATGSGAVGAVGGLHPSTPPLTAYTYRIGAVTCERAADGMPRPEHPCPRMRFTPGPAAPVPSHLHAHLSVRLKIEHGVVRAAIVTFRAPVAVTGAGEGYFVEVPSGSCHDARGSSGYTGVSTDRDLRVGTRVTQTIGYPFANDCGRLDQEIYLRYQRAGDRPIVVGAHTIRRPEGTRVAPPFSRFGVGRRAPKS